MSTTQFHHPTPARIKRFPTDENIALTDFAVIEAVEPAGTSVSLFFDDLDDAQAWLQDALDKVQLAKAELANTQPAPVHAERESNEDGDPPAAHPGTTYQVSAPWRCNAGHPHDDLTCTRTTGHDGVHVAHDHRNYQQVDAWSGGARIGQPIDLTDVAVPL